MPGRRSRANSSAPSTIAAHCARVARGEILGRQAAQEFGGERLRVAQSAPLSWAASTVQDRIGVDSCDGDRSGVWAFIGSVCGGNLAGREGYRFDHAGIQPQTSSNQDTRAIDTPMSNPRDARRARCSRRGTRVRKRPATPGPFGACNFGGSPVVICTICVPAMRLGRTGRPRPRARSLAARRLRGSSVLLRIDRAVRCRRRAAPRFSSIRPLKEQVQR